MKITDTVNYLFTEYQYIKLIIEIYFELKIKQFCK